MAGVRLTAEDRWFIEHSTGAPAPLQQRAAHYLERHRKSGLSSRLADAAGAALHTVLAHRGDRSVALDLLAADALVTLALKARALEDPAGLARFAAELRGRHETAE
ncbi:MAG TPA: hypothetical protein VGQ73_06440 [Gemmatimonadales bacterium]|jgi:uncharacterized membrane protein|nr:hypothetical protein [Gemmatimonadales bacterium]